MLIVPLCVAVLSCQGSGLPSLMRPTPAPVPQARPTIARSSYRAKSPAKKPKEASHKTRTAAVNSSKGLNQPTVLHPTEDQAPDLKLVPVGNVATDTTAQQQAEQAVNEAARKLAAVDRSKLGGGKAGDYDAATGFIKGAQQALRENDFLRAQSLAQKASALASQLASRVVPKN